MPSSRRLPLAAVAFAALVLASPARAGAYALGALFEGVWMVTLLGAAAAVGSIFGELSRASRQLPAGRDAALLHLVATAIAVALFGLTSVAITGSRSEGDLVLVFLAAAPVAIAAGQLAQLAAGALRRLQVLERHGALVRRLLTVAAVGLGWLAESLPAIVAAGGVTWLVVRLLQGTRFSRPRLGALGALLAGVFAAAAYCAVGAAAISIALRVSGRR